LQVSVYVTDNTRLKEAEFYLVDENGVQIEMWNYMELIGQESESIILTLPEKKTRQSLLFSAKDAAGNEITAKVNDKGVPTGFVISSELVQEVTNIEIMPEAVPMSDGIVSEEEGIPDFVYMAIAVMGVVLIAATAINKRRKYKVNEER